MAKLGRALGVLLLLVLSTGVVEAGPKDRFYTIEFYADSQGAIHARKTNDEAFYEIHYTRQPFKPQSSTTWTFANRTNADVEFRFREQGNCHFDFVNTKKDCDSGVIGIPAGATTTLVAEARDMPKGEYHPAAGHRKSTISVARKGEPLRPVDPDLQIERDWFRFSISDIFVTVGVAVLAFFAVRFILARRNRSR